MKTLLSKRGVFLAPLLCFFINFVNSQANILECIQKNDKTTIYDFSLMDVHKQTTVNLTDYQGKYLGLNALKAKFGEHGVEVLALPCNQFGMQEPGSNGTEILNGIKYVRPGHNFEPNFPVLEKVEVNGANEHPLYSYLKRSCPSVGAEFVPSNLFYSPIKANDVTWNFEKFLVGFDGKVRYRAAPKVEPVHLEEVVQMSVFEAAQNFIGRK